jgi:hypothetical protein
MEKLDLLSTVPVSSTGTLTISYMGNTEEPFGIIRLKDLKEERKVYEYVVMAIDQIFTGIPDLEMAVLREHTNIDDFFKKNVDTLSDDEIRGVFKDFEVVKS